MAQQELRMRYVKAPMTDVFRSLMREYAPVRISSND